MTPLVLLHAFPFDSGMFDPQRDVFGPDVIRLTPDLPGFGTAPVETVMTVEIAATRVVTFLDRNGHDRAVVGGVSMGGYVAMAFARMFPNRLSGLILADTKAEPDDDAARANRAKAIEAVRANGVPAFVESQLPKVLGAATRQSDPGLVEWIRAMGCRQSAEGVVAALAMLRDRPDARPGLADVKCPVLIVVGENDEITPPKAAESMKALVPHATLVRIPGAGHLANVERPGEFNTAVTRFLTSIPV
jgi:3-oxoadipate enol-lactonase